MQIRNVTADDYGVISPLINDWWGGRTMAAMLPKLFFIHFRETSFVAEENGKIIGFLIAFYSQTYNDEAYVHFVGVDPAYRRKDIARKLYGEFFNVVKQSGRSIVRAVTSPINKTSIDFHTKIGFNFDHGDKVINGVPVVTNYDGKGQERVLFIKHVK
ncbi:GNAT family N-acetyltransferase [Halobacillus sp. B23F22_1]|uniref:GNAT family N-acetyltransferase n=1 Tax=Halobacillus sp. B23F22_1 TaxID=3459514 RepID=UPI00373F5AB0